MWDKGLTTSEIAKQLGVSKNSIVGKVHRLSLPARPSPIRKKDEDEAELPFDRADEKTASEAVSEPQKQPAQALEETKAPKAPKAKTEELAEKPKEPKKSSEKVESKPAVMAERPDTESEKTSPKNGVSLTELGNHTCRWPLGDPRDENFCFCGKRVRSGQTYCEEHAAVAYVKPIKKG
jgi:GcrA cell cycle regulator